MESERSNTLMPREYSLLSRSLSPHSSSNTRGRVVHVPMSIRARWAKNDQAGCAVVQGQLINKLQMEEGTAATRPNIRTITSRWRPTSSLNSAQINTIVLSAWVAVVYEPRCLPPRELCLQISTSFYAPRIFTIKNTCARASIFSWKGGKGVSNFTNSWICV